MNKTKIEWCDYTWNPITGCMHGCPYCYARKMAMRFKGHFNPAIHYQRLKDKMPKKPSRIFVGSMADMWGGWVKGIWIEWVLEIIEKNPQHQFIFLTKNPLRYKDWKMPKNCLCGVTVNDRKDEWKMYETGIDFVSFEPLQSAISIIPSRLKWIVIGAQTSPEIQPNRNWVKEILRMAYELGIPVFLKDNLKWHKKVRGYPKEAL